MEALELDGLVEPKEYGSPADAIQRTPFRAVFLTKQPGRKRGRGRVELMVLQLGSRASRGGRTGGVKGFFMTCRVLSQNDCLPVGTIAEAELTRRWKGRLVCLPEG